MSVRPGRYLRGQREGQGLTLAEVAALLAMLRLAGFNRVWPWTGDRLVRTLGEVEDDTLRPNPRQLLSLTLIYPFSLARYRKYRAGADAAKEPADV